MSKVSHQFQYAPVGSVKHKVWLKLQRRAKNPSNYIFNGENAKNPLQVMLDVVELIKRDKSVFIASSLIANMLKTFGCGSSPDGSSGDREEFWRLIIVSDPFENEDIFGWSLSRRLEGDKMFTRKVSRLFYSGILVNFFKRQTDASSFASSLAGTSSHHLHEAKRICSDDYKTDTGHPFEAVTLGYYNSFAYVYFTVAIVSSLVVTLEKAFKHYTARRVRHDGRN